MTIDGQLAEVGWLVQREEMKRTAGLEEKTSFVLADAVGVTESLKHVAQPLDRERKIGFDRPGR
jgi:hypothetical protein